ncbi:MAG: amidohydrolase family protein [Planctomycetaceae bacterium]
MSCVYRARWILPISRPPIRDGWIAIENGQVIDIGASAQARPGQAVDLGNVAILPSLVNAHTHLEFSNLDKPIGRPGIKLFDWVGEVVRARTAHESDSAGAVREGLRKSCEAGVGLVGDIATTPAAAIDVLPITASDRPSRPELISMAEVLGLVASRSDQKLALAIDHIERLATSTWSRAGISPHAPYSTPPRVVDRCIEIARKYDLTLAMHVAESAEERDLIERGEGPFAAKLKEIQVYDPSLFPWGTGATRDLLLRLSHAPRTLIVHGNDLRDDEIASLAPHRHVTVVYCPRTHRYFDQPPHPVGRLLAAGVRVALGTDSLASNPDLSLWREVQWLLAHRQDIPWQSVIEMATLHGANAFARTDLGRIEVGSRASLLMVPAAASTIDQLPDSFLANEPAWLEHCRQPGPTSITR